MLESVVRLVRQEMRFLARYQYRTRVLRDRSFEATLAQLISSPGIPLPRPGMAFSSSLSSSPEPFALFSGLGPGVASPSPSLSPPSCVVCLAAACPAWPTATWSLYCFLPSSRASLLLRAPSESFPPPPRLTMNSSPFRPASIPSSVVPICRGGGRSMGPSVCRPIFTQKAALAPVAPPMSTRVARAVHMEFTA